METIRSAFHRALVRELIARRQKAGLRQSDVARRMHKPTTVITRIEIGQRRVDVYEFVQLAKILRFDGATVLRRLIKEHCRHLLR